MRWLTQFLGQELSDSATHVAWKIFIVALGGVTIGHLVFDAPLSPALVLGAMLPTLLVILVAARHRVIQEKEKS